MPLVVGEPDKNKIYWNKSRTVCIYFDYQIDKWVRRTLPHTVEGQIVEISEVDAGYHTQSMDEEKR